MYRRFAAALEGPLQDAGLSKGDVEDKLLPMQQVPPLHVTEVPHLHVTELPPVHVTEVPSVHITEVPPLQVTEVPPLHVTDVIEGKGKGPYSLAPVQSQEFPEGCWSQQRTALGTPAPDFSSGFTAEAFPEIGYGLKAAEVWNQGFPCPRCATNHG